ASGWRHLEPCTQGSRERQPWAMVANRVGVGLLSPRTQGSRGRQPWAMICNPFGVGFFSPRTQGSRGRQPWAMICNPFGVGFFSPRTQGSCGRQPWAMICNPFGVESQLPTAYCLLPIRALKFLHKGRQRLYTGFGKCIVNRSATTSHRSMPLQPVQACPRGLRNELLLEILAWQPERDIH